MHLQGGRANDNGVIQVVIDQWDASSLAWAPLQCFVYCREYFGRWSETKPQQGISKVPHQPWWVVDHLDRQALGGVRRPGGVISLTLSDKVMASMLLWVYVHGHIGSSNNGTGCLSACWKDHVTQLHPYGTLVVQNGRFHLSSRHHVGLQAEEQRRTLVLSDIHIRGECSLGSTGMAAKEYPGSASESLII